MQIFQDAILELLKMVLSVWNTQVENVLELLVQNPQTFKNGNVWTFLERIDPYFISLGSALVALFFLMSICSESTDIKNEIRFDNLLRMFIKISIAEWLVVNHLEITKQIFSIAGALIGVIGLKDTPVLAVGKELETAVENLGIGQGIVFFLVTLILCLIILCCSFILLYTVYFRFLKLYVAFPFGALAFSSITGSQSMAHTAVHYFRYILTLALEALTMALAIYISSQFLKGGLPAFTGEYETWTKGLLMLLEITFTVAFTTGSVKSAEQITQKVIGG